MSLVSGRIPHLATIASFASSHSDEIKVRFHKLLMICCEGTKISSQNFLNPHSNLKGHFYRLLGYLIVIWFAKQYVKVISIFT